MNARSIKAAKQRIEQQKEYDGYKKSLNGDSDNKQLHWSIYVVYAKRISLFYLNKTHTQ